MVHLFVTTVIKIKKRPTQSSSSNESPATVDETVTEKQSITLSFMRIPTENIYLGAKKSFETAFQRRLP